MQEFNILKCVECETFQVDLVKKAKKWSCKVCNQKQSIKKVYFNSNSAKECRQKSQEMNITFHQTKAATSDAVLDEYFEKQAQFEDEPSQSTGEHSSIAPSQLTNKWEKFLKPKLSRPAASQFYQEDSTSDRAPCRIIKTSEHSFEQLPTEKKVYRPSNRSDPITKPYNNSLNKRKNPKVFSNQTDLLNDPLKDEKYSRNSSSIEPPQKKPKQIDEIPDDEFTLSREDWDALDQLV